MTLGGRSWRVKLCEFKEKVEVSEKWNKEFVVVLRCFTMVVLPCLMEESCRSQGG